ETLESAIVFEDQDLILMNKPAGIAVHKGTGVNFGVVEALRQSRGVGPSLDLAHRLDRETSGCLLLGKHSGAVRALQAVWKARGVEKHYAALVCGHWPRGEKTIVSHMKKNQLRGGERVSSSGEGGKRAVSHVRLQALGVACSQVSVRIETGRTHQIRVHTSESGHAVLGDDKYGDRSLNKRFAQAGHKRLFLHAHRLRFEWRGLRDWRIEVPDDWAVALEAKL
ncbi:MAG: RluA family pseudouridine synthase, partial [Granulosicoccaceae bacterium]